MSAHRQGCPTMWQWLQSAQKPLLSIICSLATSLELSLAIGRQDAGQQPNWGAGPVHAAGKSLHRWVAEEPQHGCAATAGRLQDLAGQPDSQLAPKHHPGPCVSLQAAECTCGSASQIIAPCRCDILEQRDVQVGTACCNQQATAMYIVCYTTAISHPDPCTHCSQHCLDICAATSMSTRGCAEFCVACNRPLPRADAYTECILEPLSQAHIVVQLPHTAAIISMCIPMTP